MGLRAALQDQPELDLTAVIYALALSVFYPSYDPPTPRQLRLSRMGLERAVPGVEEAPAGRRIAKRGEMWAVRSPDKAADLWAAVTAMPQTDRLALLAYCALLSVHAVRDPHDRHPAAWAQAKVMATASGLDMTGTWKATAACCFGRVAKARCLRRSAKRSIRLRPRIWQECKRRTWGRPPKVWRRESAGCRFGCERRRWRRLTRRAVMGGRRRRSGRQGGRRQPGRLILRSGIAVFNNGRPGLLMGSRPYGEGVGRSRRGRRSRETSVTPSSPPAATLAIGETPTMTSSLDHLPPLKRAELLSVVEA
jgi:hypothetical protein